MTQEIVGYRKLSEVEVALVNSVKGNANQLGQLFDILGEDAETDKRWLAIAKTDLQKGFMALIRAITKPTGF